MKFIFFAALLSTFLSCSVTQKAKKSIQLDSLRPNPDQLRVVWAKDLDPPQNSGNVPIGFTSPFVYEDILYIGDQKGFMTAHDFQNGKVLWSFDEKQSLNAMANFWKDHIYYGSMEGRLFVRHYLTGKLQYSIDLGAPIESQPIFIQGRAIVHLRNHTLVSLDASTGKIFWKYKRSIPYTTTLQRVSKVRNIGNKLVVGFADGYIASLSIEEGIVNWEQKISTGIKFVDVDVEPIQFDRYIIAGSAAGPIRFLNPNNGVIEKTIEFSQSHTPIVEADKLIVGSTVGDLYKIDQFAKVLLRKNISENAISSVYKYKKGFVVATMGAELFYVDQNFNILYKHLLGGETSAVFGEVVGSKKMFALYSARNRLYIFK